MPSAQDILLDLTHTANEGRLLAVIWHALVLCGLILFACGVRPSRRAAVALLAVPALSVSALAIAAGNMFNGVALAMLAATLLILARRTSGPTLRSASPGFSWLGAIAIGYALVYPHFVHANRMFAYALFAPVGVLPCPTLALMVGLALIAGGFQLRSVPIALALVALFYAAFGLFHLGVLLDLGLLLFAFALLILGLHQPRARARM